MSLLTSIVARKDSYKYSDGDVHNSNEVSSDENGGSEESDHTMPAPVGGKRLQSSVRGKEWKRGQGLGQRLGQEKGRGQAQGQR